MTPHPPYLPPLISEYDPEELFYVVKHGVKFTGMPSWPAQKRDDEVWSMTAFLREFSSLDAEEYERLVFGPVEENDEAAPIESLSETDAMPRLVTDICGRCHGDRGQGRAPGAFPKLAGQSAEYLRRTLTDYQESARYSGIMEPVAAGMTADEIAAVSDYYSRMPTSRPASIEDAAAVERGERIASQGRPESSVPACTQCHGPAQHDRDNRYPFLAGQDRHYIAEQLKLFQQRKRGGAHAKMMHLAADGLTEQQIHDLAAYFASLTADETSSSSR